jgi:hypothetical protein
VWPGANPTPAACIFLHIFWPMTLFLFFSKHINNKQGILSQHNGIAMFSQKPYTLAGCGFGSSVSEADAPRRQRPILNFAPRGNFDPQGQSCPLGVKLSPGGEILCLPLHSSKQ